MTEPKRIAVLGSTGSIGQQTLDVVRALPGYFRVIALTAGNNLDLTKSWSVTGGFEHYWNPAWRTSLYGAYGKVSYSDTASAVILPTGALAGSSANWSFWQVGSRTVWTPVTNLDLSVDVMYNALQTAYSTGAAAYSDKSWWSGMFRVQRNFYP